jgi:hypothetical protein
MASRKVPVPYSITQLQQQFEQFRTARTGRTKLPESLWQAAVEQAREHGVNLVAHTLRLDYGGLMGAAGVRADEYVIEFESNPSPRMRVHWKGATPPDWAALLRAWRDVAG